MVIDKFDGRYRFLSNFHPSAIIHQGIKYPTVEHFYVSQKINKPQFIQVKVTTREGTSKKLKQMDVAEAREYISTIKTAGDVKRLGRELSIRPDWDSVKYDVMLYAVRRKFSEHEDLKRQLLETGESELIEGNTWHDNFFGICYCPKCLGSGQNNLGKILMQVRKELMEIESKGTIKLTQ